MELRIVELPLLDPDAEATFGGKACGLARLIGAGAKVPVGFAVEATTAPPDHWTETERDTARRRAADLLGHGRLAVRSSAIGEDSGERSFAGMLESVLGVTTPGDALAGAATCIASGGRRRVLEYAGTASPLVVGVVVQTLVESEKAGVCFTRDPAGRDGAVVIEAVEGIGLKLVSGTVEPERWRVYRTGLGCWEARAEGAMGVLRRGEASQIAAQAWELAERFGHPLDLEWAIDGDGTLWWLQARPITAAPAPPQFVIDRSYAGVDDGPVTVWSNWNVRETLPDPMFPLTWGYWREVILPMVTRQLFGVSRSSPLLRHLFGIDLIHGRIYFNMNAFLAAPVLGPFAVRLLEIMDAGAAGIVRRLSAAGVLQPRRLPGSGLRLLGGSLIAGLRSVSRMTSALRPRRALKALDEDGEAISRRRDVSQLSDQELVEEMHLWERPPCRRLRNGLQMEVVAMLVYGAASRAFKAHREALDLLTSGIPGNPTTQISRTIDELIEAARPISAVFLEPMTTMELLSRLVGEPGGTGWLAGFDDFLRRFGHRGPMEFDLGARRWSEDPTMIVELVRAGLRSPARESVTARMDRLAEARRRALEDALAASPRWRRPLMRRLARRVELTMPLREAPKHYGMLVFQRTRQAALELGDRLVGRGILAGREDVFFVEWPELLALARGERTEGPPASLLAERQRRFERFQAERAPDFLRSDGVPVVEDTSSESTAEGEFRGTAVSAGRASGPVRILSAPDPRAMEDGEVLVMEYADPGWTPLFPRAAAIVMEVGGLMCHAAVVARELGIPAVFGVRDATRILTDGERVAVDGRLGRVTRES
ncbi:MAG: hypothetical protein GY856_17915 [bacterium]|nr:hypothetical protein [bacterium]